jgi:hypothetical protein
MALFDGKLDTVDLMAIEYYENKERQEKLEYIVQAAREAEGDSFDITPLCRRLGIRLTTDEFNWILEQVQDD